VYPQDHSSAPYPYLTEGGTADFFAVPAARPRERYWLYGLLFLATFFTATITGAAMQADFERNAPFDLLSSFPLYSEVWRHPGLLVSGLPFSLTLLAILLAHEFGHYLAALYHRVDASLPYFMPSPFIGTFGAFIRVRSPIYSKRALFDIGIAGPLAGFVFLLPALGVGLALSKVVPNAAQQGMIQFGVPPLQWLVQHAVFPGVRTVDLYLHPVARAAWVGMFATAMNLLPIGQLDGGHILYAVLPGRHRMVSKLVCVLMLFPMAVLVLRWMRLDLLPGQDVWAGWSLWGVLLLWLGRRHPLVHDPTLLGRGRMQLAWVALAVFALCITLTPFIEGGL